MTILLIAGHIRNDVTNTHIKVEDFSHIFKVYYNHRSLRNTEIIPYQESATTKIVDFDNLFTKCNEKMNELQVMERVLKKINPFPRGEITPNITYQILKNRQNLLEMVNQVEIPNTELTILTRPDVDINFDDLLNFSTEENTLYVTKKSAHCEFNIYHLEDIVMWGQYETIKKLLEFPDYYEQVLEGLESGNLEPHLFCCPHTILGFYVEYIRKIKVKKCHLSYEFGNCEK